MFKINDFLTAVIYQVLNRCSYNTARKIYNADRSILGVDQSRKITVKQYLRLYGGTLDEFNQEYKQAG